MDIKLIDSEKHAAFTGIDNRRILNNIAALGKERKGIVVRVPTIMGINGDDDNIRETARFVKKYLKDPCMELLPYHRYGEDKHYQLGMPYSSDLFRTPSEEELQHLHEIIEEEGVHIVSFK